MTGQPTSTLAYETVSAAVLSPLLRIMLVSGAVTGMIAVLERAPLLLLSSWSWMQPTQPSRIFGGMAVAFILVIGDLIGGMAVAWR